MPTPEPSRLPLDDGRSVSALLLVPSGARACYVMAHGAGAGMTHPFMAGMAGDLFERGIATLRFQFPFMEEGSRRPDAPAVAQAAVRAAVAHALRLLPGTALVAGGRSFGGRMASQAQADAALPSVRGLAFLGFPLHPAKRPSRERARHLSQVRIPMLFLQGSRDALAEMDQLQPVLASLGSRAALHLVDDGDHAFHVPARTGRRDADIRRELAGAVAEWIERIATP